MPPRLLLGQGRASHPGRLCRGGAGRARTSGRSRPPHGRRAASGPSRTFCEPDGPGAFPFFDRRNSIARRHGPGAVASSRRRRLLVRRHARASGLPGLARRPRDALHPLDARSARVRARLPARQGSRRDGRLHGVAPRRGCGGLPGARPRRAGAIPLPEAPHRGYHSAMALFGGVLRKTMSAPPWRRRSVGSSTITSPT